MLKWGRVVSLLTSCVVLACGSPSSTDDGDGDGGGLMDAGPDAMGADAGLDAGADHDAGEADAATADAAVDGAVADGGPADSGLDAGPPVGACTLTPSCEVPLDHATVAAALADVACERIRVREGAYTENLTISRDVAICGEGLVTLDGAGARPIEIDGDWNVHLEGFEIHGGNADRGGGLSAAAGTLRLERMVVRDNIATGSGGGVYQEGGSLALVGTRIADNRVEGLTAVGGGGLHTGTATVVVDGSVIEGNVATAPTGRGVYGGGLWATNGDVTVRDSRFAMNTVDADGRFNGSYGGGLASAGGALRMEGTTVVEANAVLNRGVAFGGGVYAVGTIELTAGVILRANTSQGKPARGGGAYLYEAALTGVVVEDNVVTCWLRPADGAGGGLYLSGGNLVGVTVARNQVVTPEGGAGDPTGVGGGIGGSGTLRLESSVVENNVVRVEANIGEAAGGGGGISFERGELTIVDTRVSDNSAAVYGGASSGSSFGGGVRVSDSVLTIQGGSVVRNNSNRGSGSSGGAYGGGVGADESDVMIEASTLEMNQNLASGRYATTASGGGFYQREGSAILRSVTIADNATTSTAGLSSSPSGTAVGGGVTFYALGGSSEVVVTGSTVRGNAALGNGSSVGGGVALVLADATRANVEQSTVAGNDASMGGTALGGGLYAVLIRSTVSLRSSTVAGNISSRGGNLYLPDDGNLQLRNTIVYGGVAGFGPDCVTDDTSTLTSEGYSLFGSQVGCTVVGAQTGDVVGMDPLLSPLDDHGGSTRTHLIGDGGPAHDAGDPLGCTDLDGVTFTTDQRGLPRPVGRCDIGAVELAP